MSILIFKTDIRTEKNKQFVHNVFAENPLIEKWNIDMDDRDFVLRIVSESLTYDDVIIMVTGCGFACEELI